MYCVYTVQYPLIIKHGWGKKQQQPYFDTFPRCAHLAATEWCLDPPRAGAAPGEANNPSEMG